MQPVLFLFFLGGILFIFEARIPCFGISARWVRIVPGEQHAAGPAKQEPAAYFHSFEVV